MGLFSDFLGLSSRDDARDAASAAALGKFNLTGPGGMSVGFTPTSANVALGSLDPIRAMLASSIPQYLNAGSGTGQLSNVAQSISSELAGQGINPAFLGMLQSMVSGQRGTGAAPSFGTTGLPQQLMSALMASAGSQLGSGATPNFGSTGLPAGIRDLISNAIASQAGSGATPNFGPAGLSPDFMAALSSMTMGQRGSGALPSSVLAAVSNAQGTPDIDPGLVSSMSDAARNRLATAGADTSSVIADRLALLRGQAQPFEQDFIQKNIGDLFAKGRFGSNDSLSGKVMEGVTRALSGADMQRQLEAVGLGRQMQDDAVRQGTALASGASGINSDIVQRALARAGIGLDAFSTGQAGLTAEAGRFGNLASLLSGEVGNQFSRNIAGFEAGQAGRNAEASRLGSLTGLLSGVVGDEFNRNVTGFEAGQMGRSAETQRLGSIASLIDQAIGGQFGRNVTGFQAGQEGTNSEIGRITSLLSQIPGLTNVNSNNALARFGIAQQLFDSQQTGQNASFARGMGALSGIEGIDQMGMNAFMAALQSAVAKSNAAGAQSQIYNTISQNRPIADTFTGLLGAFMPG